MALRFDLRINQGETFQFAIPVYQPGGGDADLTGSTVRGQIRSYAASPVALYEWSSAALNLAFEGNDVVLTVPAAASSAWDWRTGQWSVELTDVDGNVTRLVEGYVIVHPEVTR